MNSQQTIWYEQVLSDYKAFKIMEQARQDKCQVLHYLQMLTEKLAKTYFLRDNHPPKATHAVFVKYLCDIGLYRPSRVIGALRFKNRRSLENFILMATPIAHEIEKLAPSLSNFDKPNIEYPWPHKFAKYSPSKYHFPIWDTLYVKAAGRNFLYKLDLLVLKLPEYI